MAKFRRRQGLRSARATLVVTIGLVNRLQPVILRDMAFAHEGALNYLYGGIVLLLDSIQTKSKLDGS